MQIFRQLSDLDYASACWCADGDQFALVPTMGALHDGHLALIGEGKRHAARVAATIFVNPLQFNDPTDLERYPRDEEADLAKLETAGCDAVWLPKVDEIYPQGFATTVSVRRVSDRWEGEHRPGHFDGVATVVAKLLISTLPNFAIFGEKDWQQLAVIRQLERDLDIGVDIIGYPTVRDSDGLALSSRNAHLSADERQRAVALPTALQDAAIRIGAGERVGPVLAAAKQVLVDAGFLEIDYFALVDAGTLEPLESPAGEMRLIAAATIGGTRLIDNVRVVSDTVSETGSPPR
jgi:pantoate--beta-alanine ligase